jgi:hypothetical protein
MFGLLPAWTEQERTSSLEGIVRQFCEADSLNAASWLALLNRRLLALDRVVADVIFPPRIEEAVRSKIRVRSHLVYFIRF